MNGQKESLGYQTDGFEALYQQLNTAQKEAVDTIEGPVVVIAGPGTGKTQVLTLRIANIVRQSGAGVGPENILALTFTNAAVTALRERLGRVAGAKLAYQVGIFTFHSFAEESMRTYPEYTREFFGRKPASDLDRLQIIESVIQSGEYALLKTFASDTHYTKAVVSAIDKIKQEGITPDQLRERITNQEKEVSSDDESYYKRNGKNFKKGDLKPTAFAHVEKNKELAKVYEEYQVALEKRKLYDFNDILLNFIATLQENKDFQALIMERYQYILVDEHQDTNGAQNRILELITETPNDEPPNLFTVGDDKQAIYRFQGASIENFLHFTRRFAETKTIDLTHNYRSTQPILDVAQRLVDNDTHKQHTPLVANTVANHEHITVQVFESPQEELAYIAAECKQKIAGGVSPAEIAIFYRENKFLASVQEALEKEGVPYVVSSKENILTDPVMRKLIWLLRAVANPLDNERLGEALLMDIILVDPLDALILFDELRYGRKRKFLLQLLQHANTLQGVQLSDPDRLVGFANFIQEQKLKGESQPFVEFFDSFVRESGFLKYLLAKPGAEMHVRQLASLFDEVRKNVAENPVYRLSDFLRYIETLLEYGVAINVSAKGAQEGVQLMTAHGSKGLEFDHVYITDVVHGRWNDKKRINHFRLPIVTEATTREDDRRLLYVALTRAKKSITLTYAQRSSEGKPQEPSIFIDELTGEHVEVSQKKTTSEMIQAFFAPRIKFSPELTSPEYIKERFLATKLSATALNNYYKSPLVYFFRNLIRLPQAQTKTLLYGNVVHKALELFFQQSKEEGNILSVARLLGIYQEVLEQEYLLHEYYEEFSKRGKKNLEHYYTERQGDFTVNMEPEKRLTGLTFTLHSGEEILLTGILDKLEYLPDGTVRVIDYKTGKAWSEKNKDEKISLRRQIVFYKLLLESYEENGKKFTMTEGVLDFVEPNKKGFFETERIVVTDADCEMLKQEINDFAEVMLNGRLFEVEGTSKKDTEEYQSLLEVLQGEG
jgi:DNA helicase-2/ATP-dependent DNA helicase PcrA